MVKTSVALQTGNENLPEIVLPNTEAALRSLWTATGQFELAVQPERVFRSVLFGSARVPEGHRIFAETTAMARAFAEHGIEIVTGGGPGLMEAANIGALEGQRKNRRTRSHGVCIYGVNNEQKPNDFLHEQYMHHIFLTRLHHFLRLGAFGAFILCEAGGYGTDLERALVQQVLQVGHLKDVPFIAIGEMWREYAAWAQKWIVGPGYAKPRDANYMICVEKAADAVPIVLDAFGRFKANLQRTGGKS